MENLVHPYIDSATGSLSSNLLNQCYHLILRDHCKYIVYITDSSNLWPAVGGGIGGFIVLSIFVIVFLIIILCVVKKKKKRNGKIFVQLSELIT